MEIENAHRYQRTLQNNFTTDFLALKVVPHHILKYDKVLPKHPVVYLAETATRNTWNILSPPENDSHLSVETKLKDRSSKYQQGPSVFFSIALCLPISKCLSFVVQLSLGDRLYIIRLNLHYSTCPSPRVLNLVRPLVYE